MARAVHAPRNTMLADLEEALHDVLRSELATRGLGAVDVAFEAPTPEWSAALVRPAVNLFLHDVRWRAAPAAAGRPPQPSPPATVEARYAVTAWARDARREHRLLGHVRQVLADRPQLPGHALAGRVREPAEGLRATGGPRRPSLEYAVRMPWQAGPGRLAGTAPADRLGAAAAASRARLDARERQVLALIAAGHATREVAAELCYSERTVKKVLHDAVVKMDARSRTQAVACAVREGLI